MKVHQTQRREVVTSHGFRKEAMDINDRRGMAMAVSMLRDKLYTDKILAVVREYSSNAKDEHEKYCPDKPITVHIPTATEPFFSVRDEGKGLSEDGIFNVFGKMFKSTKADEDFAIGGFGIGAKAGHAYGDSFSVISYYEGTKYTYEAVLETELDKESGDELTFGQMYKISEEPSDEPSGIEVIVNVNERDIVLFTDRAKLVYNHWKVKPKTNIPLSYTTHNVAFEGDGWQIYNTSYGNLKVLIGGIAYKIDTSNVDLESNIAYFIKNVAGTVSVPINALSIAPNREQLEYTNRTKKVLESRIKSVYNEVVEQIQSKVDKQTNWIDANATLRETLKEFGDHYIYRGAFENKFKWGGENIKGNTHLESIRWKEKDLYVYRYVDGALVNTMNQNVTVEQGDKIYYLIDERNAGGKAKARTVFKKLSKDKRVVVIKAQDQTTLDAWLTKNGIPKSEFGDWSKVEKTSIKYTSSKSGTAKTERALIGATHLHKFTPYSGYYNDPYQEWPKHDGMDNNIEYVWVPLDAKGREVSYDLLNSMKFNGKTLDTTQMRQVLHGLIKLGVKNTKLIGVRQSARENIPDHWTRIDKFVNDTIKDKDTLNKIEEIVERESLRSILPDGEWSRTWMKLTSVKDKLPDDLRQFMTDYENSSQISNDRTRDSRVAEFANCLGIEGKTKDALKLTDLSSKFLKQYPLLKHINFNYYGAPVSAVVDYINAIKEREQNV